MADDTQFTDFQFQLLEHLEDIALSLRMISDHFRADEVAGAGTEDDPILSAKEVALRLRVKVDTLFRWRLHGGGPAFIRMGRGRGRVGYRKSSLDQYIDGRVSNSTSDTAN